MKKFYLIGFMGLSICAFAQTSSPPAKASQISLTDRMVNVDREAPSPVKTPNPVSHKSYEKFGKTQQGGAILKKIGSTQYVFQFGSSSYRRVMAYPDGKVSVTWTTSSDNGTSGFLSRGSGYNSFDGSNWGPVNATSPRIESFRTGFPSIVSTGTKEIIVAHRTDTNGLSRGLLMNTNTAIGSTTWSTQTMFEPPASTPSQLWARSTISGNNLIVLGKYQDSTQLQPNKVIKNNVTSPLVYSRYDLTTNTWVDQDKMFPNYDTTLMRYQGRDVYSMDANGSNVAVVYGYAFTNLVLWKSANGGATWTTRVIDSFPVRNYVYDADTLPQSSVPNGSVHVTIDAAGKAHVFVGMECISDSAMGDGKSTVWQSYKIANINDGILYWSEYTPDSSLRRIATSLPVDGDSTVAKGSTDVNNSYSYSVSDWPCAGIDATGNLYLIYSSLTVGDLTQDGTNANFRDVFVTYSTDHGTTWATPQNATSQIGVNIEQAYPSCAKFVDDRLHMAFLSKNFPGDNVASGSTDVFDIDYMSIPVSQIMAGKVGLKENASTFTIDQNYPNPFHENTSIDVNFKHSANATLTVMDVMGKQILSESFKQIPAGKSTINIHVGEIPAGVYFYTIESEGTKTTQRMMVY